VFCARASTGLSKKLRHVLVKLKIQSPNTRIVIIKIYIIETLCWKFQGEELWPLAQPEARGLPLVAFPRLIIRHFHSYPPYLEYDDSNHKLRTRHGK